MAYQFWHIYISNKIQSIITIMHITKTSLLVILITFIFCAFLSFDSIIAKNTNAKYEMWKSPSFFRGMNILPGEPVKTQKDFDDLKAAGASFASLSCDDILNVDSPYQINQDNIYTLDSMVKYCRNANLYYTISARSGPGRRDVYYETEEGHPKSTIWINSEEQHLYASMIKMIVGRYGSDDLFVGIAPIVEPNPLFDKVYLTSEMLKQMLVDENIDISIIYNLIIDSVRSIDAELPILIQNVAYSSPEFYKIMTPYSDPFVVYEFHSYRPQDYTKTQNPNTKTYPGSYISIDPFGYNLFNKNFFVNSVFRYVKSFQAAVGNSPVLLGEFGLLYPQNGGDKFLEDLSSICIELGWHFAYWVWRGETGGYNIEEMGYDYWEVVKRSFAMSINSIEPDIIDSCINIYPVIVRSDVTIKSECGGIKNAILYDVLGNFVMSLNSEFSDSAYDSGGSIHVVNLSGLATGQYFIILRTDYNVYTRRIIKVEK